MQDAKNIEAFWNWFVANAPTLDGKSGTELADIIHSQLTRIDADLGVLVCVGGTETEVVFTGHAAPELAGIVRSITEVAPALERWRFIAFVPAAGERFVHERPGGVSVDSAEVRFQPLESSSHPASIGLRLYVPAAALEHDECDGILWSMVVTAAGEELACHVEHVEGADVANASWEHLALAELPSYLRWRVSKLLS